MRATLKIVLPLIVSVASVSLVFAGYQVRNQRRILRNDLARRAEILADSLQESIERELGRGQDRGLRGFVERYGQREHLRGIAIYDTGDHLLAITPGLEPALPLHPTAITKAMHDDHGDGEFLPPEQTSAQQESDALPVHVYAMPLHRDNKVVGALLLVHDTGYIEIQVAHTLRDALLNALVQTLLISALALLLVRWTFTGPLTRTAKWVRTLRTGQPNPHPALLQGGAMEQLHHEVTHLARDLHSARTAAEVEARLRDSNASLWTAERLSVNLRERLQNQPLFVVSNREPYMHVFDGKDIKVIVPASGVVTALEPVLLACNGTWVASGSGSADREVVDSQDRLRVPPDRPSYTLRRIWLTEEENKGYYDGFSNEGLWPLCHIAHTRPIFRPEDWLQYQRINQRFADTVLQEMADADSPILLAQDYHLALVPRMVKDVRPDARVAIFWHIPWPNAEVFGICPWQRELIEGLLGADLIGFHIQTHCNNFLETVDRGLEALTEWDRFAVSRQGHVTRVRPYPISVEFHEKPSLEPNIANRLRAELCDEMDIEATHLGVGVDRVDYTKGILERFRALERFFELNPGYCRRFTFVQIGAPSRTDIDRYRNLLEEVNSEAERINDRFQTSRWKPIVFRGKHHSHEEISRFYKAASFCMVTSLHDGMNLVAKEFVASREDERGVLILSTFAGAAHELSDALLVNPYDISQVARAIHRALEMPEREQTERMQHMRHIVRQHNVYRWAAHLLFDLTEIRIELVERAEA